MFTFFVNLIAIVPDTTQLDSLYRITIHNTPEHRISVVNYKNLQKQFQILKFFQFTKNEIFLKGKFVGNHRQLHMINFFFCFRWLKIFMDFYGQKSIKNSTYTRRLEHD